MPHSGEKEQRVLAADCWQDLVDLLGALSWGPFYGA
jgi:hypothetical protein